MRYTIHMTHFLQSAAWGRFQESLGRKVVRDSGDGWSYLAILEKGKINSRLYAPYGPTITKPGTLPQALASLQDKARDLGATFIRVEPLGTVSQADLEIAKLYHVSRVQPEATSVVDLARSNDDIIAFMSQNNRNLHRNFVRRGLEIHTSSDPKDISILTTLLHGVAEKTGMHAHSDAYLRVQAETFLPRGDGLLYYVTYEDKPVVAALIYDYEDTRYYGHAAADYEHRKLSPGTIIVSHMMLEAKAKGLAHFDLYGIWPQAAATTPQAGITRFKRSFGGHDVVYNGTWELPIKKSSYGLYHFLTKFTKGRI